MELHNMAEDLVFALVDEILTNIEKGNNPDGFCTCDRCRMDTACYVLNRTPPRYIASSRGAVRVEAEPFQKQQQEADIVSLVYEGIRRVNHNQRPNVLHGAGQTRESVMETPVFNIPTIMGRVFQGQNFAPVEGAVVRLFRKGGLVAMKDANWQNPCALVPNTDGAFTFWPDPIPAEGINIHEVFEFNIRIESEEYETLNHFFKVPMISDARVVNSFSLGRTVKLPDLYLFPPGMDEDDLI
ncbi:MAG: late competence development ComFB family protein [Treponema sp.]|jgi:competence protein ComFB|nr:late competence development ComFB family protein [Treponema sp.]